MSRLYAMLRCMLGSRLKLKLRADPVDLPEVVKEEVRAMSVPQLMQSIYTTSGGRTTRRSVSNSGRRARRSSVNANALPVDGTSQGYFGWAVIGRCLTRSGKRRTGVCACGGQAGGRCPPDPPEYFHKDEEDQWRKRLLAIRVRSSCRLSSSVLPLVSSLAAARS